MEVKVANISIRISKHYANIEINIDNSIFPINNIFHYISTANFLEAPLSESPGSTSSLTEYSIDAEMSCLSNSNSSSNSKPDNGVSQKFVGGVSASSGKSSNVLKRHLDGYPANSANPPGTYPQLQPNSNQNHPKREPPIKKTKVIIRVSFGINISLS